MFCLNIYFLQVPVGCRIDRCRRFVVGSECIPECELRSKRQVTRREKPMADRPIMAALNQYIACITTSLVANGSVVVACINQEPVVD